MTDIAQLGLAIDSSQAKTAATNLNNLQTAANGAAAAADKLSSASGKSGTATKAISAATTPAVTATNALAKASNDAARAHQGMSTQAMSAFHSIRSMTEGMLTGQSTTQVLTQQLNHLSYAASGPGGITAAFKEALGSLTGLITPASAVALAIGAIGAAGVLTFVNLEKMAVTFDDIARAAGTTTGQLHGLQQAASFKGIGETDFFKAMEKFSGDVYSAQHNMGALADVMRANGKSAKDFTGYLEQAADLIKNASSDQARLQLLQQMGLPATMDWVRFLSQGKDGIRAATAEAAKFNESAEGQLVASAREFDDAWNTATTKMVNTFKAGMADIIKSLASVQVPQWLLNVGRGAASNFSLLNPLGSLYGGAIKGGMQGNDASFGDRFGSFATTGNAGALQQGLTNRAATLTGARQTVDPNVLKDQISKEQQSIAVLGNLASVEDLVRAKQLEINAARLNGIKISKDDADSILTVTRAQAEMSRVQETAGSGIYRTADAQKAMNDNLKALVERDLLDPNKPEEYNAALNSLTKQMEDLSDQAKVAASNLPQLQSALNEASSARKQLDSFSKSTFDTFSSGLTNAITGAKSLKSAFSDMATSILSDLTKLAVKSTLSSLFGSISGLSIPKFASGTNSAPGGLSIVGEKGPELVNLPRGAQVFNAGQTRGMLSGGGGFSMGDTVININGNADDYALSQIRAELAVHRKAIAAGAKNSRSSQRYAQTGVA